MILPSAWVDDIKLFVSGTTFGLILAISLSKASAHIEIPLTPLLNQ